MHIVSYLLKFPQPVESVHEDCFGNGKKNDQKDNKYIIFSRIFGEQLFRLQKDDWN
jgi:hypothetical protein